MRAAMAAAPVGDDQYGEDPTVNALQERVAALLGKEAALWLPSGTMANQVALRVLTRPGDDVIVSRESHAGLARDRRLGGQRRRAVHRDRQRRPLHAERVRRRGQAARPRRSTRRRRWSRSRTPTTAPAAWSSRRPRPSASAPRRASAASRRFLDGARLWNAAVASGRPPSASWRAPFDLVARRRCRRGSARRSARCSPARATLIARGGAAPPHARRRDAPGRHLRRRRPVRARAPPARGSPTTTPTRACSPSGSPLCPASRSTSRRCRPTSSCSRSPDGAGRGDGRRAGAGARRPRQRARRADDPRADPPRRVGGAVQPRRRRARRDHRCAGRLIEAAQPIGPCRALRSTPRDRYAFARCAA